MAPAPRQSRQLLWLCWPALTGALTARRKEAGHSQYYWPHSRGRVGEYGVAPHIGPRNLTAALRWSWHHPAGRYHTTVLGGLFDDEKNVYLAAEDGIRKFSPDGRTLWYYNPHEKVPSCSSIMDGALFGSTIDGRVFALSMATGKELWVTRPAASAGGDTFYVEAHAGVVVSGIEMDMLRNGGNKRMIGLNASDGSMLWEFRPTVTVWNVMPMFPDDDTVLFQDLDGGVYRLGLRNGTLLWRKGGTPLGLTFTDGGAILGPNGVIYAVGDTEMSLRPNTTGHLSAYRVSDGQQLWSRQVPHPPNSWPAVGQLRPGNGLSVVIPVGLQGNLPGVVDLLKSRMPLDKAFAIHNASLQMGDKQQAIWKNPTLYLQLRAYDAATGDLQWVWQAPSWHRKSCAGDEEGLVERMMLNIRLVCWPGPWSSPTIAADGTVYVGHENGMIYAVRDKNGDGKIDDATEVDSFDTGASFLHSGFSFAPGMSAMASCDSLYVFDNP